MRKGEGGRRGKEGEERGEGEERELTVVLISVCYSHPCNTAPVCLS